MNSQCFPGGKGEGTFKQTEFFRNEDKCAACEFSKNRKQDFM